MNIYIMVGTLIANIIGIAIVYQFIKSLEKKEKLIFIAISVALMYILISIVYWFSGFGIDKTIHEESKNFVTYLFVPVNVILFIPYFASQYMKLRLNQIKVEKFINKLSTLIVLLVLVLIFEYFYFKNIQQNIKIINDTKNETTNTQVEMKNEEINNELENNNIMKNEIIVNKTVNENKITSNVIINQNILQNEL